MKYKIIDLIHSFAIKFSGSWKKTDNKVKWVKREWAEDIEIYAWWLKWQYNLTHHGEQDWCEAKEFRGSEMNIIKKFLFKLLI